MELETVEVDREKAKTEYEAYKSALATHFVEVQTVAEAQVQEAYSDLMSVYGHLRHGRSVIDLRQAIRDTGFHETGWPKLAIVRADYRTSFCGRNRNGRLFYMGRNRTTTYGGQPSVRSEDVVIPDAQDVNRPQSYTVARTPAPLIPPKFLPKDGLAGYYVLWEAEEWQTVPARRARPPRDPFLLARVNDSIFVVLASWEMTDLERMVLAGRIA